MAEPNAIELLAQVVMPCNRIRLVEIPRRLHYIDWINRSMLLDDGTVSIMANADIMFDRSIGFLRLCSLTNKFITLSRYNNFTPEHSPRDTQDCWAFNNLQKPSRLGHFLASSNIPLGTPGCDNRIAAIAYEAGYALINPCNYIMAHHVHNTQERSYDYSTRLHGSYCLVHPALVDGKDEQNRLLLSSQVDYLSSLVIHGRP